jgi:hypothetical protein
LKPRVSLDRVGQLLVDLGSHGVGHPEGE